MIIKKYHSLRMNGIINHTLKVRLQNANRSRLDFIYFFFFNINGRKLEIHKRFEH